MSVPTPTSQGPDPLTRALRAFEIGRALCDCPDFYHPVWACLRATGAYSSLSRQEGLLRELVGPRLRAGAHLLIGGSADEAVFELMSAIAGDRAVRITVADRCRAPLRMVADAAAARGADVRTLHVDLADLPTDDPHDLVFLHYTLSFMEAPTRQRVMRRLADGLRPGGAVFCVSKHPGANDISAGTSAEAQSVLSRALTRVASAFGAHPDHLRAVTPMLEEKFRRQSLHHARHPGPDRIVAEFAQAGLVLIDRRNPDQEAPAGADRLFVTRTDWRFVVQVFARATQAQTGQADA